MFILFNMLKGKGDRNFSIKYFIEYEIKKMEESNISHSIQSTSLVNVNIYTSKMVLGMTMIEIIIIIIPVITIMLIIIIIIIMLSRIFNSIIGIFLPKEILRRQNILFSASSSKWSLLVKLLLTPSI